MSLRPRRSSAARVPAPTARRHYGRQPVVTTRPMPQRTSTWVLLAQVTIPVTGSPPVVIVDSRNAVRPPPAHAGIGNPPRRDGAPGEPWVNGSTRCVGFQQESGIDAKDGCSRGKQQEALHKAGVVSRVPRRSRLAQASETDRDTDQTGSTHQHAAVDDRLDGAGGRRQSGTTQGPEYEGERPATGRRGGAGGATPPERAAPSRPARSCPRSRPRPA